MNVITTNLLYALLVLSILSTHLCFPVESQQEYCGNVADLTITNGGCACDAEFLYNKVLSGPGLVYNFQVGSLANGNGWCTSFSQPTNEFDRVECVDGTLRVTVNVYGVDHQPSGQSCPAPPRVVRFPTGPTCSLDSDDFCEGFKEQTHDTGIRCNSPCSMCGPSNGITKVQCDNRKQICAAWGFSMKWTGKGCRSKKKKPLNDGGCQCEGYCGYKCKRACKKDPACKWKNGACYVSETDALGTPMPICPKAQTE